jgi:hypothetical protein
VPEVALAKLVVVIESGEGAAVGRVRDWLATDGVASESVAETVKLNVPLCEGVPASAPEFVFSVTPEGRVPEARLHLYGACPPVAVNVVEYTVPELALGRLVVVIDNGGITWNLR